ncbi:hypothetical protein HD554DRAFT_1185112 [Boletus coccyginus]|nr:hypothetical protein HD554DRAFT_1185112 [Boletus coccyginus]
MSLTCPKLAWVCTETHDTRRGPTDTFAPPYCHARLPSGLAKSSTNHSNLTRVPVMRQVLLLLQSLFSAARRALSLSGAVLPLIRIIAALQRFVRGCFKSLKSPGVSTLSRLPESHSTTPQRRVQSAQAPDRCMPSSLPTGLHGQQELEDVLLPQHSVAPGPDITSPPFPKPLVPQWFQRYKHRRPVEKRMNREKIKAGQMSFLEEVPDHWERVVHPEGARYYFNANKNVFTDISLSELGDLSELHTCIRLLRAKESQLLLSSTFQKYPTQLVIQHVDSEHWFYYFVNHDTHAVFWVEDFDLAGLMPQDILGVTEDSHIMYAIEVQYWWHCEQYPSSVPLLQEHVMEVWGTVAYAHIDNLTSIAPLYPFSQDELVKMLGVMPYLQGYVQLMVMLYGY